MPGPAAILQPVLGEQSIADPTPLAPRIVVWGMAGAQFGLFLALLCPVTVSLALKAQTLVPATEAAAVTGNILSGAAFFALVSNPVFGRLSDITTSRFGRRRPWMICGSALFLAALFVMAKASSVAMLFAGWALAQTGGNAILAPLSATIADQVPVRQRARVGANLGVMQNFGILSAAYVARWFINDMLTLFLLPGAFAAVLVAVYCLILPDKPIAAAPQSEGWRSVLETFWVNPRRHPDFAWVWISRFMVILSIFLFITFRLFFLQHRVGLETQAAVDALALGVFINTAVLIVFAKWGGWISDRSEKRKIFVFIAILLFSVGMALLAVTTTTTMFYVVEAIMGAAYGVYTAVDTALVIDVLPNKDNAAKDLGVLNIANVLPQSLAGSLGAALLAFNTTNSDNYTMLFVAAGLIGSVGAVTILPIRGVK